MSESVLVAFEDPLVRMLLGNALSTQLPFARVKLVETGGDALSALSKQPFQIALVDEATKVQDRSPEPLWQRLATTHPHLPLILLGAPPAGAPAPDAPMFPKPLQMDQVVAKVISALADGCAGELQGVGLPAFLQLIEVERKTCAVLVKDEEREGQFAFNRGLLVHARQGEVVGEAAALEMLTWSRPSILVRHAGPFTPNVTTRLAQLILEAFRMLDERAMPALSTRSPGALYEPFDHESDAPPPVPPCTAEELLELCPGIVHGLVIRRRTGRILLFAGAEVQGGPEPFARSAALAYETAAIAAAPAPIAELVSFSGDRATLLWPSVRAPATLIVIMMKRSNAAFALAVQLLRLRGW